VNSLHEIPPFEPLDSRDGPALPLSPSVARAQADAVVKRALSKRRVWPRVALFAGLSLAASGAMAAVIWHINTPFPPAARQTDRAVTRTQRALSPPRQNTQNIPPPISETILPNTRQTTDLAVQPEPARTSIDWLRLANAARARSDYARAERLYLRIVRSYPDSDDAAAANLAAAELRYQHLGRARDALPLLGSLLRSRPNGPLAEQARAGIARTYAVLGDAAAERGAWLELLREHPSSWFAAEARSRLNALHP
jgi:tetratricopeptide (TPR) repeat protein